MGSFEQSDLRTPWARRRAALWVVICAVLLVGLVVIALTDHRWYVWLLALYFLVQGLRTGRRLVR